jgi:predicted HNH restriction endonuclease
VLAVHHVDQNRTNNKVTNLAWLCHNCHHLVHRYPIERKKVQV